MSSSKMTHSLAQTNQRGLCQLLLVIILELVCGTEGLSYIIPRTFLKGFMDQGHLVPKALCLLV